MRTTILAGFAACFLWAFACARLEAADYSSLVRQTRGLLCYYRFEETGQRIADASGHGRPAEVEGEVLRGVDSAYDELGQAIRLSGSGYVRVPDLGTHDALSIELWLNQAARPASGLVALYAADDWRHGYAHFNAFASGKFELALNGVSNRAETEDDALQEGLWIHLVATYERATGSQRLFRNGRVIHESTAAPAAAIRLRAGTLGAWLDKVPTRQISADLDEVAIYGRALTIAEVQAHYVAGHGSELPSVDFARQVQPILVRHCYRCHGPDMQESELRLDRRASALGGGESGEAAIVPFDSEQSYLLARVTAEDAETAMPPEGPRLAAAEIATLRHWIDGGAAWPDALAGALEEERITTKHWSFQPVRSAAPPQSDEPFVRDGNGIDAFILARLEKTQLAPSPEADRRTLLRRLHLVMHGLPPTPEAIAEFTADRSPAAWQKRVDQVLASSRYGERWASHWLDVIRYGETHGFEVNTPRPNAWPYRDYVIKSLNDDKPYDRFIREQIAGDQLGVDSATGFLVAAPALLKGQTGKDEASIRQARADELHEVIVTVGSGVLGLTIGCARCHNHKFDPISQRDYYQLQAMFAGLHYGDRPVRDPGEVRLAAGSTADSSPPADPARLVFGGTFTRPDVTYRLYRGEAMQRRERLGPGIPAVFGSLGLDSGSSEPARRLALADWLVDAKNPLTPRVIVNRVWQHHFGTGLVPTPSDFGGMGVGPSHPELLDWLATQFMADGWSLKKLHRLILLSSTFRQASRPRAECLAADAGTRLLWRFAPRRLEMEPVRDAVLYTTGVLDLSMGGPGFSVFKPNTNYVRVYDAKDEWGPAEWRRMIYAHRVRMAQDGVFGALDCPDAGQPAPVRSRSTTAIQALNLLNSSFMHQQARLLAERVSREAGDEAERQLDRLFQLAYGRGPTATEQSASLTLARRFGMPAVARAVLNSSEFLFIP